MRRLLHRWFVEFNPLYLLSAMLVLGGMFLCSRELAREDVVGVAAIAELYSFALIGGAALLMRVGHRRSAVMLAVLTIAYQCDLTLHTETSANLGTVAIWASAGWLLIFVCKLFALAWAMRVRLSRGALLTFLGIGGGLAVMPYWIVRTNPLTGATVVAMWLFGLVTAFGGAQITSKTDLDGWAETVFRRTVKTVWLVSGSLVCLHVVFWCATFNFRNEVLLLAVPLLFHRSVKTESRFWMLVCTTLVLSALLFPPGFCVVAYLGAVALGLRARRIRLAAAASAAPSTGPYRGYGKAERDAGYVESPGARERLLVGAVSSFYLALWTIGWSSHAIPPHILALDIAFSVVMILGAVRARLAIVPVALTWAHCALHVMPVPHSMLAWGGAAISLGFMLLFASLAVSYWLRAER